jgi:hypothetical protein
MTNNTLVSLADELRDIAFLIESNLIAQDDYYPRGTILKALPDQTRFKPKSMWVSLGDGTYRHLNGEKGLITTHSRLDGYTSVIFSA